MKDAFKFDEFKPSLDWYECVHHIINYGDFNYFKLHRRYGPSWWLFGIKYIENEHRWEEKEIGEITEFDLLRFIDWSKTDRGSRILGIHMICSDFDIFNEVARLHDNSKIFEVSYEV